MTASRLPRDELDLFERLSRVDAAAISDAGKSLRILPPAIRPVSANARLPGRAVTADAHDDLLSVLARLHSTGQRAPSALIDLIGMLWLMIGEET